MTSTSSGFKFLEPVSIGHYTLHVWCIAMDPPSEPTSPNRTTKTKVSFRGYLPRGTNGVRLQDFTAVLRHDDSPTSLTPHPTKPHASVKSLNPVFLPNNPEIFVMDVTDYQSPFLSSPTRSATTPVTSPSSHPTRGRSSSPSSPFKSLGKYRWQMSLYADGCPVDPTQIPDFSVFSWTRDSQPWTTRTFTKEELCGILQDIISVVDPSSDLCATTILKETGDGIHKDIFVEPFTCEPITPPPRIYVDSEGGKKRIVIDYEFKPEFSTRNFL